MYKLSDGNSHDDDHDDNDGDNDTMLLAAKSTAIVATTTKT